MFLTYHFRILYCTLYISFLKKEKEKDFLLKLTLCETFVHLVSEIIKMSIEKNVY